MGGCSIAMSNGFVWKCWVNIPNEIAIFHRDNDQQNHWVQWGTQHFQTHPNGESMKRWGFDGIIPSWQRFGDLVGSFSPTNLAEVDHDLSWVTSLEWLFIYGESMGIIPKWLRVSAIFRFVNYDHSARYIHVTEHFEELVPSGNQIWWFLGNPHQKWAS